MNKEDLDLLIKAGNNFYLNIGENPGITDYHYDQLVEQWESENPGSSVMELFDFPTDKVNIGPLVNSLNKVKLNPEDIIPEIKEFVGPIEDYIINYKHDGSSICGEYRDGKLINIYSTPSDPTHAIKMLNFGDFFPRKIEDPSIKYILGEVLVSTLEYGEKARQNANAAVNCKKLFRIKELKNHAFIRAYYVVHQDEEYEFDRLRDDLSMLSKYNSKLFKIAENLSLNDVTTDSYSIVSPKYQDHIMIDGYVVYKPGEIKGFKFKCMDYVDVQVKDIIYEYHTDTGNYVPIIKFDPFTYQGTERRSLNPGGITVVLNSGLNVGSTFRYIGIGNTIPGIAKDKDGNRIVYTHGEGYVPYDQLTEELTKTLYRFPKCECGTQLTLDGIIDSNLYCTNPYCSKRLDSMKVYAAMNVNMENDNYIELLFDIMNINGITENKYSGKFDSSDFNKIFNDTLIVSDSLRNKLNQEIGFNEWVLSDTNPGSFDFESSTGIESEFMDIVERANLFSKEKLKLIELNIRAAILVLYKYKCGI